MDGWLDVVRWGRGSRGRDSSRQGLQPGSGLECWVICRDAICCGSGAAVIGDMSCVWRIRTGRDERGHGPTEGRDEAVRYVEAGQMQARC